MPNVDIIIRMLDQTSGGNKAIVGSLTELKSAIGLAEDAIRLMGEAYEFTVGATLEYDDAVREMAYVTALSAEEASRMLDLLDRYGINAGEAAGAARKLAQDGLNLSLPVLQDLAEKYQALQSPGEKQQFLMENLGRAGFEYARVLSLSREELGKLYQETEPMLVRTEESLKATEEYSFAVKDLEDNWLALKVGIGEEVIPQLSSLLGWVNTNFDAIIKWTQALVAIANPFAALSILIADVVGGTAGGAQNYQGGSLYVPPGSVASGSNPISGGGGGDSIGLSPLGGGRASGGPVSAGMGYVVGENGPELFVPGMNGGIVPNGAGGGSIIVNFTYAPALGFATQSDFERAMPMLGQAVRRELSNQRITG